MCDLHLVFGEVIAINRFTEIGGEKPTIINTIRDELGLAMNKCMWLPDKDEYYDARKKLIHNQNTNSRSLQILKEGKDIVFYSSIKLCTGLFLFCG